MKIAALIALALAMGQAAPAAEPAGPQENIEGLYVAHMMETASVLYLGPDDGFQWGFSTGALDLVAEGRWRRDGEHAIVLTTLPPVTSPGFELAATGRDDTAGLRVRLDEASAVSWPYLDVEAEFADGTRARESFQGPAHVFSGDRRIVALRLGSVPFDFQSPPFPIDPARGNVLTFHFLPNDIGIADFRDQRVVLEAEALSFTWRGMDLRYVRQADDGATALQSCAPADGARRRLDIGLAEPLSDTIARSTYDLEAGRTEYDVPVRSGCEAVDLVIRFRGHRLDAGVIGGSHLITWALEPSALGQVESVDFHYQDRLLELGEALERARSLRSWFETAGFVEYPAADAADDGSYRPFQLFDGNSAGERAADWDSARRQLADEAEGASAMHLFTMRSGDYYGRVLIENLRRATAEGSGLAYVRTDGEHEWRISVRFMLDPAMMMDINFPTSAEEVSARTVAPVRAGPILPWEVSEGAPSVGLYDISLGEDFQATVARSTFPFQPDAGLGNDFADGIAEVRIRWGDSVYDAGRVSDLSWYVNDRGGVPYVKAVGFSHEDRLLDLHEALVRARALRDWLEQAGFTLGGPDDVDERPPFSLIHPYRYDEQVADWAEAEALLADADSGVQGLDLYRMRAGGWHASVTVINYSRVSGRPAGDPVRQWDLQVGFDSDLDPVPPSEDDEAE